MLKGLILGMAGILLSCVGLDPILSIKRFTFGQTALLGGTSFIPVMIGMFGIGEVFYQIYTFRKADRRRSWRLGKSTWPLAASCPQPSRLRSLQFLP